MKIYSKESLFLAKIDLAVNQLKKETDRTTFNKLEKQIIGLLLDAGYKTLNQEEQNYLNDITENFLKLQGK